MKWSTGTSSSPPFTTAYESQYGPPTQAHAPKATTIAPGTWSSAWRIAGTIGWVSVPDSVTTILAPSGMASVSTSGRAPAADCDSSAQQASGMSTTKISPSPNQSRAISMQWSLVGWGLIIGGD